MRWVFFPLHPDTPADGQSLDALFAGRGVDLAAMQRRMTDLMRAEGLPYGDRTHTYNSRLAQELGKWADARGVEAIHDVLYRAYFVDNQNIGDIDELVGLAQSAGLPPDEVRDVLMERRCKASVDADWMKARQYGVTAVPTFVAGDQRVVGAQAYEVLEQLVSTAGAVRLSRSPSPSTGSTN